VPCRFGQTKPKWADLNGLMEVSAHRSTPSATYFDDKRQHTEDASAGIYSFNENAVNSVVP